MKCIKKVETLPAGTWVRLKRTIYKDDLAQVRVCVHVCVHEVSKAQRRADLFLSLSCCKREAR